MDTKQTNEARRRLTLEHEKLVSMINRNRAAAGEIKTENTEDEGDLATISHDKELLNKLNEGDFARLKFIEDALKALDNGVYGECAKCEEEINEKRLIAIPWATLCIKCQEAKESESMDARLATVGADDSRDL